MISTGTTPSLAAIGSAVQLNNNLAAASITILYFDYCLTVGSEIDLFWGSARFSAASMLFVINRYLGLLGVIPVMLEYFGRFAPERCRQLQSYHQYYSIAMQVVVALILILRTNALYDGNKRVLWTFGIMCPVLAVFTVLVTAKVVKLPSTGDPAQEAKEQFMGFCNLSLTAAQGARAVVGWLSMLCVESTIFGLTLFKSVRMRTSLRHGVLRVVFRDGAIYYGTLCVVGAMNIMTFLAPEISDNTRGVATTLTNALSTTLTSRMCLNLRDPALHRGGLRTGRWTPSQGRLIGLQSLSLSGVHRPDATQPLSFRRAVRQLGDGDDIETEPGGRGRAGDDRAGVLSVEHEI